MADVVVRVGAALKGDVGALYKPYVDGAKRANERVRADTEASEEKKYRAALKYIEKTEKAAADSAKKKAKVEADAAKDAAEAWDKSMKRFASSAAQNLRGVASFARSTFGSILRGMGVNLDLGASVSSAVANQKSAVALAHKGFQEGAEGAAGARQNPADLLREAGTAANATGKSIGDMLDAMTAFTESSGDLEVARKMIVDIGKVSNATGAEMRTLGEVAGRLDFKLQASVKDAGQRQQIIGATLRTFAAEGKTGAIDVEQLAPQLTKLAAVAGKLGGGMTEAFQTVGIMAQLAPQGGAANPAMAARSVTAVVDAMMKSKTGFLGDKGGAKAGVHIPVFTDESRTTVRNPLEVVAELVKETKGDLSKMVQAMPNIRGQAIGTALQSTYVKAGGGAAGEAAINAQVEKLKKAVMSQEEVERENAEVMQTTAAKAQVFQNNLESAAASLVEKVLPQFEKLAPKMLGLISVFDGLVAWAANNPVQAIILAIVGSIAKASIGTVVANAIRGQLTGTPGASPGGPGGAGSMLGLGATALVGGLLAGSEARTQQNTGSREALSKAQAIDKYALDIEKNGGPDADQRKALREKEVEVQRRLADSQMSPTELFFGKGLDDRKVTGQGYFEQRGQAKADAGDIGSLQDALKDIHRVLNMQPKKGEVVQVHVTNPSPAVDGSAQHKPGAP